MPHTLPIDKLVSCGACDRDACKLKELYPNGIPLHPDQVSQLAVVNVTWAVKLLTKPAQIELAKIWYDRAIGSDTPDWKAAIRAMVDGTTTAEASTIVSERAAVMRPYRDAGTPPDRTFDINGVALAMAHLAKRYADGHAPHSNHVLGAMVSLQDHCVDAVINATSSTRETVKSQFYSDILSKLDQYGWQDISDM